MVVSIMLLKSKFDEWCHRSGFVRTTLPSTRGVDPYVTGGTCPPPIFMIMVMVMSPNILEVMSFRLGLFYPVTATTVYFNANILCSFTQKKLQLLGDEDPLPGLRSWTPMGDFRPPDPQSFFYIPPIIL